MDTFMDKLAQKFTAQEMIKANAAAEAEEMNRLKIQVQEYTECLNRMQRLCDEMERTAEAAKGKVDAVQLNTDGLREQLMEIWQNVQDMQNTQNAQQSTAGQESESAYGAANRIIERIDDIIATQSAQTDRMKAMQAEQQESMQLLQQSLQENMQQDLQQSLQENLQQAIRQEQQESAQELRQGLMESLRGMQNIQMDGLKGLQDAQFETMRNSLDDQLDSVRTMVKAQVSGIKSGQESQFDAMRRILEEQNNAMENLLGEMKTDLETHLNGANDFVHRECVKVYRNVQAVVGEENNKQSDNIDYLLKPMAAKVKTVFNVSAAALAVSLIGVVLQVLSMLHIL